MVEDLSCSKILIADDSYTIVNYIAKLFTKLGYSVFSAFNGNNALELVYQINPDLVILDITMPYLSGLDVCRILKSEQKTQLIPIIILTASQDKEDRNRAIEIGANDYLQKPSDPVELKLKVESLLKLNRLISELENANNIIIALAKTVEAKDKYIEGHGRRVSQLAKKIGGKMNLSATQIKDLTNVGLLHDIGKIGISDHILNKPGRLTEEEFTEVKRHPSTGAAICSSIKSFDNVSKIIRHHHEKLNGKGYPDGISGEKLNIETKIITAVDIYDALTSSRPYRRRMETDEAVRILLECTKNGELDKEIVEILIGIIEDNSILYLDDHTLYL